MSDKNSACGTCGDDFEVITEPGFWGAWGRNAFDFNYQWVEEEITLCGDCESEEFETCSKCGDLIDTEVYGTGYPENYCAENEAECPKCIDTKGLLEVSITQASSTPYAAYCS